MKNRIIIITSSIIVISLILIVIRASSNTNDNDYISSGNTSDNIEIYCYGDIPYDVLSEAKNIVDSLNLDKYDTAIILEHDGGRNNLSSYILRVNDSYYFIYYNMTNSNVSSLIDSKVIGEETLSKLLN